MTTRIVRKEHLEHHTERFIEYRYVDDPEAGFTFTADAEWNPVFRTDLSRANYAACLTGSVGGYAVSPPRRVTTTRNVWYPALLRCRCGEVVTLDGYDNDCDKCGAIWNMFGQELKPRDEWGEW